GRGATTSIGAQEPTRRASTIRSRSAETPAAKRTTPAASTTGRRAGREAEVNAPAISAIATAPNGRLMKNTQRQDTWSVSTPPAHGPSSDATPHTLEM